MDPKKNSLALLLAAPKGAAKEEEEGEETESDDPIETVSMLRSALKTGTDEEVMHLFKVLFKDLMN